MIKVINRNNFKRWITVPLTALLMASFTLPASPAGAQASEVPSFADGEWVALMGSNSQVVTAGGVAVGGASGTASFTSAGGLLTGTWNLEGTAALDGEASGTAHYIAQGNVSGSAESPRFPATSNHIDMRITIDSNTVELSQDLPAGESSILVVLTHATCSQVIGYWNVSTDGLSGSGTFVATRMTDLIPGSSPDYLTQVTDLMVDAGEFRDAAIASGRLAPGGLEALLTRAQELDRALSHATDCSSASPDSAYSYLSLIAGVVADLLQFALDNPLLLDSSELRALVTALLSTGAYGFIGDDAIAGLHGLVGANMDAAIASGDPIAISNMVAAAAMIGAWDVVEAGEAALGDE